ncbi:MAG TPA: anaerobic sulfatase maturase, partial [Bryobacteraceae bacterium]|nr:anaerobic sulfatase maturase [Bryobacteraceae bacterium]
MTDDTLARLVDTYLFYSYPDSTFAFQGGEPTLAGVAFFERLVELEKSYGRNGQNVSNAMQTNGILLDDRWCELFKAYHWLIGISIDGPEPVHDLYRFNKAGAGTWRQVMSGVEFLKKHGVELNALCVVSQANVAKAAELYRFFRALGIDYVQYIPLSEFDALGQPLPFTITPEQYGRFLCEMFDLWWPDRREVRIRYFDNIAEALAGQKPGTCTMHETCDSYVVVEYNGDVYPCDFFVEGDWKLGNINVDSWAEIARKRRRYQFAATKTIPHPECQVCEYQSICHGGCPKHRHDPRRNFNDLDYFCQAYKMIFAKSAGPLSKEVQRITGRPAVQPRR